MRSTQILTRTALLLALTVLFQSLRFVLPIAPVAAVFIIGTLVNACLLIAGKNIHVYSALVIAVLTPVMAYFQQQLPVPVFIIPVALGNIVYILLFGLLQLRLKQAGSLAAAASGKTLVLFFVFRWLVSFIGLSPLTATGILSVMSWPQLVTGILGGVVAIIVSRRLQAL